MKLGETGAIFSATDLIGFSACAHLTTLDWRAASGEIERHFVHDPMLELLRERGMKHEADYVAHLTGTGKRVVTIGSTHPCPLAATTAAMREGVDVIVQGRLEAPGWAGWADVLLRVPGRSNLGPWRYEPVETKLATTTRGSTLLQLSLYADFLDRFQDEPPAVLRVVVPERQFEPETYRFDEYRAYARWMRRRFEEAASRLGAGNAAPTYPEPVSHCDVCNWYASCEERRRGDDHLSLVANIQRTQRRQLEAWSVETVAALAVLPIPLQRAPDRGSAAALERVREQARLQCEARAAGRPVFECLPVEADCGLAALPLPSSQDVFLDLEGDRMAEGGGLEYLFGYAWRAEDEAVAYEGIWALTPDEEKLAFERFIDEVVARRERDPTMHVFHYAPYEPTAMKRLMGKYGTRADELDDLLRGKVFVDLFAIVKKAIRAGIESYSIKKLEPFYGLKREVDLPLVSRLLRAAELAIARGDFASMPEADREAVRGYNRDDCVSTLALRDWLEKLRAEEEVRCGNAIARPALAVVPPREETNERLARTRAVADALLDGLPHERDVPQQAQWVLAHLLEWHRREDKVGWWEYFRLNEATDADLVDEPSAIGQLVHEERLVVAPKGGVVDRYRFALQDTQLEVGDKVHVPGSEQAAAFGTIAALDLETGAVEIKKSATKAEVHPGSVFVHDHVANPEAAEALLRLAESVQRYGIDGSGPYRAARDLLLRHPPRLGEGETMPGVEHEPTSRARTCVAALHGGVLAIQGPPGAGKTYTAARMIVDLVRRGHRVGVTAVSHKVIRNLLDEVVDAAKAEKALVRCMHRLTEKSEPPPEGIEEVKDAKKAIEHIQARTFDVVGATAWTWVREEVTATLDYLFVDEAGQMSLANVLACAQAANNLVLLGDPQQLEQPQKAAHPDGADASALEHLLAGRETIADDRGVFLGQTWRLHPAVCQFTSELFYESKLLPHPGTSHQELLGDTPFVGSGLHFVPVAHQGNRNSSAEEAECIAGLVHQLVGAGVTWRNRRGEVAPITLDDVLVVAPYNVQVAEIGRRMPGARVGTVDKFQGQEAPVVIYSMTTSTQEEAPRGMEFLFSRNRLNVATSRARCVCILVANPGLFELECKTPGQMRMANAFCRYLELARHRAEVRRDPVCVSG